MSYVAIVGSRDWQDALAVRNYVAALPYGTIVVTGGATGVDTFAERAGLELHFACLKFLPDYVHYGKRAPLVRNRRIVEASDRLVAFWNGSSRGTNHAIGVALRLGVPVEIHRPEGAKAATKEGP